MFKPRLKSFPVLQTDSYQLRKIKRSDIDSVFKGLSNPRVSNWYGVTYASKKATQSQMKWYRRILKEQTGIWWAICSAENPTQLLGTCGFYHYDKDNRNADMGYWLHEEFWGQGIMSACLPVMLAYAFSRMHVHRVEAEVEPENFASIALLGKLGFQFEGRRRQCEWKNDHYLDLEYHALLKLEFK
jgi:ribosomal-protein-alanine N-acetyltransferase